MEYEAFGAFWNNPYAAQSQPTKAQTYGITSVSPP